jgi:hypothetical protein
MRLGSFLTPALRNAHFAINCRAFSQFIFRSGSSRLPAAFSEQKWHLTFQELMRMGSSKRDSKLLYLNGRLGRISVDLRNFGETSEILETFEHRRMPPDIAQAASYGGERRGLDVENGKSHSGCLCWSSVNPAERSAIPTG